MVRLEPGGFFPFKKHLPLSGVVITGDHIKECCFAGPIGADEGQSFSFPDLQVDIEKDFQAFEGVVQCLWSPGYSSSRLLLKPFCFDCIEKTDQSLRCKEDHQDEDGPVYQADPFSKLNNHIFQNMKDA